MKEHYQTLNDMAQRAKTSPKDKDYLYTMFQPLMFSLAHKYCNSGDSFEEWLQRARLAFAYALAVFDPSRGLDFAPFCKRYLSSALYTIRRRENRHRNRTVPESDNLQTVIDKTRHDLGADIVYEENSVTEILRSVIAALKPEEQELVRWHYEEGKPLVALAKKRGYSKNRIYRERDKILKKMQSLWKNPTIKSKYNYKNKK